MRMQLVFSVLQVAPIAMSLIGATAFSGWATEVPQIESRLSTIDTEPFPTPSISAAPIAAAPIAAALEATSEAIGKTANNAIEDANNTIAEEPNLQFSHVDSSIIAEIVEPGTIPSLSELTSASEQPIAIFAENPAENPAESLAENPAESLAENPAESLAESLAENSAERPAESSAENLSDESFTENPGAENLDTETLSQPESNQFNALALPEDSIPADFSSETQALFTPIALSDLAQIMPQHWQIAQAESIPESETPQPAPEAEDFSAPPRWRFNITPNAFVPLSINGRVTVRDFRADLDLGLSDVLEPLNFALAGRVEAWRGNLGLIFDAAYFDLGQDSSSDLSLPNCLCNILPSRIDTEINVQYGQFDLGFGYRYGTDVSSAATEFEMGPLVFDAILGIRIYAFEQEINISTNLGGDRNLQSSTTIITPLASGRIRWNVSPTLAGWVRGDVAGFGIGGTLFATSFTAGIDWLFAGDTSLLLAYRLSTLQYTADVRGEELGLNLLLHGPYLGMVFRF